MLNLFSPVPASCCAGCVLSVHCQAQFDYTTTLARLGPDTSSSPVGASDNLPTEHDCIIIPINTDHED